MALLTAKTITDGAEALFQATITMADLLVKVDVLTKTAVGWHLIEVKSSTKYKPEEQLPDGAFQIYILQQAFERGVLNLLAEQVPEHPQRLNDPADRLWDQLTIFRNQYRH